MSQKRGNCYPNILTHTLTQLDNKLSDQRRWCTCRVYVVVWAQDERRECERRQSRLLRTPSEHPAPTHPWMHCSVPPSLSPRAKGLSSCVGIQLQWAQTPAEGRRCLKLSHFADSPTTCDKLAKRTELSDRLFVSVSRWFSWLSQSSTTNAHW